MRVATKITFSLQFVVIALVIAYAWVEISRESERLRQSVRSKLSAVAREAIANGSHGAPELPDIEMRWLSAATVMPNAEQVVEADGRMRLSRGYLDPRGAPAALEVSQSTAEIEDGVRTATLWTIGLAALIMILAGVYSISIASRFVSAPADDLIRQFRRVGAGDLAPLPEVLRKDEFGKLATELDAMIGQLSEARATAAREHEARVASLEQLRHADRLVTVGRLASGVAHELGTPLNVIMGYAKMIATRQETGEDAVASAAIIHEQTQRVTRIVRQLLDFARRGEPRLEVEDVRLAVRRAIELIAIEADKRRVRVRYEEPDQPILARIDVARIAQVVVNLGINAIHASTPNSEIAAEIRSTPAGVEIAVIDRGAGIAADQLPNIFEPFFTTKPVGEGTGLGLAVSHGIALEHGGKITVESELGSGSTFVVHLVLAQEPS